MERKYNKIVLIGLDGVDWRLLKPWIDQGKLPALSRLVDEGVWGPLQSTIRPESSVAWSSFSTGVNPGKHGVFGFVHHEPNSYRFHLANSTTVAVPRFWDILGNQGIKVGLVNIPFTYPPTAVNGFLVGGMLTPTTETVFTYPPELQKQLLQNFGEYYLDASETLRDKQMLVDNVLAYTEQQRQTALFLMQQYDWDFFAIVFTGPDRLQHKLWADMDADHCQHDPTSLYKTTLLTYFQTLDAAVRQIYEQLPDSALLLLMSDHGFNAVGRRFYVNKWLQAQGLLCLQEKQNWRSYAVPIMSSLKSVPLMRRIKRTFFPGDLGPAKMQVSALTQTIDWTRTQVYYAPDGGLRINLQGREPKGIVSQGRAYGDLRQLLKTQLRAIKDPLTDAYIIADVFDREELYHGRFAIQAPDLIIEPQRENTDALKNIVLDGSTSGADLDNDYFGSAHPYSANHAYQGILIAWGKDVVAGTNIANARIIDLAPTILTAFGVPIPEMMDGRFLTDIFVPDKAPVPIYADKQDFSDVAQPQTGFDIDEEAVVIKRLRELGYLE